MSSDEDNDEDDDDDYFNDYDDDEHQINRYLDLEMRMVERNNPTLTKLEVGYMYTGDTASLQVMIVLVLEMPLREIHISRTYHCMTMIVINQLNTY